MKNEIKKYEFKLSSAPQLEVVPLQVLTSKHASILTEAHRTTFYQILVLNTCAPTHYMDANPVQLTPFSLVFIDKERVQQYDSNLNYNGYALFFTEDFYCTQSNDYTYLRSSILFNTTAQNTSLALSPTAIICFFEYIWHMRQELLVPDNYGKQLILKNQLQNMLLVADREKIKNGAKAVSYNSELELYYRFKNLLENNFLTQKFLPYYYEQLNTDAKTLQKACTSSSSLTPKKMMAERILVEAKRLLTHSNKTMKEIGAELGFEEHSHFTRFFINHTTVSPTEYRRANPAP